MNILRGIVLISGIFIVLCSFFMYLILNIASKDSEAVFLVIKLVGNPVMFHDYLQATAYLIMGCIFIFAYTRMKNY